MDDQVTVAGTGFGEPGIISIFLNDIGDLLLATTPIANRNGDLEPVIFPIPNVAPGSYPVLACRYSPETGRCLSEPATAILNVQAATTTTTTPSTTTTTESTTTSAPVEGISTTSSSLALASVTTIGGDPPGPSGPTGIAFTTTSTSLDLPGSFAGDGEGPFPDLEITAVEVTQGIQDLGNRMPLIADKRTLVRVYVAADRTDGDLGNIAGVTTTDGEGTASVGNDGWENVDGLIHLQGGGQDEVIYALNAPITAYHRGSDRIEAGETLNFEIPDGWSEGEVEMTVLIWSFLPETIVTEEPDAGNNFAQGAMVFHEAEAPQTIWFRLDTKFGAFTPDQYSEAMADAAESYVTFHPVATPNFLPIFAVLGPGTMVGDGEPSDSFDYVAARNEPLNRMRYLHALFGLEDLERMHGLIPSSTPSDGGGLTSWNSLVAWSKPTRTTPAHEAAHMYFIKHAPCQDDDGDGQPDEVGGGGWGWIDQTYPSGLPSCSIAPEDPAGYYAAEFGEEVGEFSVYSNDPAVPPVRYPYMGYKDPDSLDAYHYCLLMESYDVSCNPASIGLTPKSPPGAPVDCGPPLGGGIVIDLCLWNGQGPIDTQGGLDGSIQFAISEEEPTGYLLVDVDIDSGALGHAELLEPTAQNQSEFDFVVERAKNGDMSNEIMLRVTDASGQLLAQVPVSSHVGGHSDTSGLQSSIELIPWFETAASLDLLHHGEVVDSRQPSASPVVTIDPVEPAGNREFEFSWTGSDPDGDDLLYTAFWSVDGGTSWRALDTQLTEASAHISDDLMLPGGEVLIKVTASDGLNIGSAVAGPVDIPGGSPRGVLVAPDAAPQYSGQRMTFQAHDPEDGQITDGTWSSSIDGDLGEGHVVGMAELSQGTHEISVVVSDSEGNETILSASVEVTQSENGAPRSEGAVPDAEALVLLGPDQLDQFELADSEQLEAIPEHNEAQPFPWAILATVAGLIAVASAGLVRRRAGKES